MARYTPDEREQWFFLPDVTDPDAPTSAEFTAGTDITCAISAVSGFTESASTVDTPDLCSRFTKTVPGRITVEAGSITFYMGDDPADLEAEVKALLPRGTTGYIARVHPVEGAAADIEAGTVVELWAVEVMSNSVQPPTPGEAATFVVSFSHPAQPVFDAEIAA